MTDKKSPLGPLSEEKRKVAIEKIIDFFATERNTELGVIAAEDVLDFFLNEIGDEIYNRGVEDAKALIQVRFENLQFDIETLLKK